MQIIEAVLFEPVGCLAEFAAEPFLAIAAALYGRGNKPSQSGSRSYWHLLNLMEASGRILNESERELAEAFEVQAVAGANAYDDVVPALSELRSMGIKLFIASSLSNTALGCFLKRYSLHEFFSAIWTRDNAEGVKAVPLARAIGGASLDPDRTMFVTDSLEGLNVAKSVGVQSILMMNEPDEAKRLALHGPAGGIVSLHELPDFIRLVAAENAMRI